MKLKNIFKKSEKKVVKPTVEKINKTQLEKVVGGAGDTHDVVAYKDNDDRVSRTH